MGRQYFIDTNSLLVLVRYYAPFDADGVMEKFLENNFSGGAFKLLDAVFAQSKRIQKKIIIKTYGFLGHVKKLPEIHAEGMHHRRLRGPWSVDALQKNLTAEEFESKKAKFIKDADFQLIAYCFSDKENRVLVTEETATDNDGKPFKKIPKICEMEGIRCITIADLLTEMGLTASYRFSASP